MMKTETLVKNLQDALAYIDNESRKPAVYERDEMRLKRDCMALRQVIKQLQSAGKEDKKQLKNERPFVVGNYDTPEDRQ